MNALNAPDAFAASLVLRVRGEFLEMPVST